MFDAVVTHSSAAQSPTPFPQTSGRATFFSSSLVTAIAVVQYGEYRITRSWPLTIGVCTSHALARTRTSVPCGSESGPRLRHRCAAKAKAGLDRLWSCTSVVHGVACARGSIQVSWGTPRLPLGAKGQLKHDGSNLERGAGVACRPKPSAKASAGSWSIQKTGSFGSENLRAPIDTDRGIQGTNIDAASLPNAEERPSCCARRGAAQLRGEAHWRHLMQSSNQSRQSKARAAALHTRRPLRRSHTRHSGCGTMCPHRGVA
jgi:hypothetical protein